MKSSLKLIIDATRIAINKSVENVTKKFSTKLGELEESIIKKIPIKLSELENDLVDFDTLVDDIESKMDKENPVGTGSFSMNRQDDSLIGDCSAASGCGTVANHFAENVVGTFNEYTLPCYDTIIVENQLFNSTSDAKAYYADAYEIDSNDVVWLSEYKTTTWKDIPVGSYCMAGKIIAHNGLYCGKVDDIKLYIVENKSVGRNLTEFTGKRIYLHKVTNQKGKYAHVVGNGESDEERSNAHTVDWGGNAWYRGDVYTGGSNQDDTNAKKLATEEYVDEHNISAENINWLNENCDVVLDASELIDSTSSGIGFVKSIDSQIVDGETYKVTIDGTSVKAVANNNQQCGFYTTGTGFEVECNGNLWAIVTSGTKIFVFESNVNTSLIGQTLNIKIEHVDEFYSEIPEESIPSAIARKADIQPQVQVDWNEFNITATSFIKNKPQGLSNFENDLYWAKETKELVLEISDDYQGVFDVNTYVCGEEWFCKENFGYELTLDGVTYTEKNSTIKEQNTNQTLIAAIIEIKDYGEICFFRDENGFYVYQIRIDNGIKEHLSGTIKFYSKNVTLLSDTETVDEESLFIINVTQNADKSYSSDKTLDEVKEAYKNGKVCVVKKGFNICTMSYYSDNAINFGSLIGNNLQGYSIRTGNVVFATTASYETKIDTSKLETTNKTIVSAINELHSELDSHTHAPDVTAEVGQMIVVKAVDENSKPTEWEAVNVPTGGASHWDDIEGKPFYEEDGNVVQYLPEKFIPSTIARTNDIQNYINESILGGEW